MSSAYNGGLEGAGQFVKSSSLRAKITLAMDYWFSNDFTNIACLDSGGLSSCPCGTPGFWNPNWFSNVCNFYYCIALPLTKVLIHFQVIGLPTFVGQTCLLLQESLTASQMSSCTSIGNRSYAAFGRKINGLGTLTGANTLGVASIGIDLGLLTGSSTLISDAYNRVHNEVAVQNAVSADGIRADGSFGQHMGIIYNGNYGKD